MTKVLGLAEDAAGGTNGAPADVGVCYSDKDILPFSNKKALSPKGRVLAEAWLGSKGEVDLDNLCEKLNVETDWAIGCLLSHVPAFKKLYDTLALKSKLRDVKDGEVEVLKMGSQTSLIVSQDDIETIQINMMDLALNAENEAVQLGASKMLVEEHFGRAHVKAFGVQENDKVHDINVTIENIVLGVEKKLHDRFGIQSVEVGAIQ